MIKGKPYIQPPSDFQPGDRIKFEGKIYTVLASSHTHSQLDGLPKAVANWQMKRVRRAKSKKDECLVASGYCPDCNQYLENVNTGCYSCGWDL